MGETAAVEASAAAETAGDRVLTGIDGLDELLGGGGPRGPVITGMGSFGTGKTTFALPFLTQGLLQGEKGIFISLVEDVDSVVANAASFGWDLRTYLREKKLHIVKLEPADAKTTVTRIKSELPEFIRKSGATRSAARVSLGCASSSGPRGRPASSRRRSRTTIRDRPGTASSSTSPTG